jgi:pilus assembly protein Flp/PilA
MPWPNDVHIAGRQRGLGNRQEMELAAMQTIHRTLTKLRSDVRAVTALEYAMIASLIAIACVTIITSLGTTVSGVFSGVSSAL